MENQGTTLEEFAAALSAIAHMRRYEITPEGMAHMVYPGPIGYEPRNWTATVAADRRERSGVARTWLPKGQLHWYDVSSLSPGAVIEIGSSSYSCGRAQRKGVRDAGGKMYRQIVARTPDALLAVCVDDEMGDHDWQTALALLTPAAPVLTPAAPVADLDALREERARLTARIAEIDAILAHPVAW